MNSSQLLQKLEWEQLLVELASFSQTDQGAGRVKNLQPNLTREEVESSWSQVVPLKHLSEQGYIAPIGYLPNLTGIFKALAIGQILEASSFLDLASLLKSTKFVHGFAADFALKARILEKWRSQLYPIPKLLQEIDKTIGPDGQVLDDASKELDQLRRQKRNLAKKIQDKITQHLHDSDATDYLQDDFFTIRNDRFVIPLRLDARGRVEGTIVDTSASGQTLFLEPSGLWPLNQQLQDLQLAEKLEIIRILRELSVKSAKELDALKSNYELLIELDFVTAKARLAQVWKCHHVELSDHPILELYHAIHPLLHANGNSTVPNDILLEKGQSTLVISGPNAGGKTVALKTVGIVHLMAKAGLLIPVASHSKLFLFRRILLEMGDGQNLAANLSTFSSHLLGLKPILETSTIDDLVLLDEISVGTEPQAGAAIAQAVVEDLTDKGVFTMVTTHFERLKLLAMSDSRLRNGSMEYGIQNYKPTFRLILDIPGQSYGIELAEQTGLPEKIIQRAKSLRGVGSDSLEKAIAELMVIRNQAETEKRDFLKKSIDADVEKSRWKQEVELLQEQRQKATEWITKRFEVEFDKHRSHVEEATEVLKRAAKLTGQTSTGIEEKNNAKKALEDLKNAIPSPDSHVELPGVVAHATELAAGDKVFVVPLGKVGNVLKVPDAGRDSFDVLVGVLKVRAGIGELRLVQKLSASTSRDKKQNFHTKSDLRDFPEERRIFQTALNTCNLRGLSSDDAVARAIKFIDTVILRGESAAVLVHGHGTSAVKNALRRELKNNCPYEITFRPGFPEEGGDAVTIVFIKD